MPLKLIKTAAYKFARPAGNTLVFFFLSAVAYVSADYWQNTARKSRLLAPMQFDDKVESESNPPGALSNSSPARRPASHPAIAYENSAPQDSSRDRLQDRDAPIAYSPARENEEGIEPDDIGAFTEDSPVSEGNFPATEDISSSTDASDSPTSSGQAINGYVFGGVPLDETASEETEDSMSTVTTLTWGEVNWGEGNWGP